MYNLTWLSLLYQNSLYTIDKSDNSLYIIFYNINKKTRSSKNILEAPRELFWYLYKFTEAIVNQVPNK